jgi:hypothetical protein
MWTNSATGETVEGTFVSSADSAVNIETADGTIATIALADIQQPPSSEWGPTRKLGRGLGNICYGITELPPSMASVNYFEGNSAAFSYGVVRGLGRVFALLALLRWRLGLRRRVRRLVVLLRGLCAVPQPGSDLFTDGDKPFAAQ